MLGLILRDTFVSGLLCTLTALANILTSDKVNVDVARQVRTWSGTLLDDKDFEEAVSEILPIYAPPPKTANDSGPTKFEGVSAPQMRVVYNAAAQNEAFAVNMPRYDVRHQLKDIKVKRTTPSPLSHCIHLTHAPRFPRSSSLGATIMSLPYSSAKK